MQPASCHIRGAWRPGAGRAVLLAFLLASCASHEDTGRIPPPPDTVLASWVVRVDLASPESVDRVLEVTQQEAAAMSRRLAVEEGIFAGMSSGRAAAAAVRLASELTSGTIVSIVCDRGDRYLSSDLFDG